METWFALLLAAQIASGFVVIYREQTRLAQTIRRFADAQAASTVQQPQAAPQAQIQLRAVAFPAPEDVLAVRLKDMQARNPMRRKSWQVTRQELERKAAELAKEN